MKPLPVTHGPRLGAQHSLPFVECQSGPWFAFAAEWNETWAWRDVQFLFISKCFAAVT